MRESSDFLRRYSTERRFYERLQSAPERKNSADLRVDLENVENEIRETALQSQRAARPQIARKPSAPAAGPARQGSFRNYARQKSARF